MTKEFLSPSPPPPAIRNAMAKAVERKQKNLPLFDFSSGNVGNLPLNSGLFSKIDIKISDNLPVELKALANGLREGLLRSYYPLPRGLAYSPTGGTELTKKLVIQYFRKAHGAPLSDSDVNKVIVTAGGQQAMMASLRSLRPSTNVLLLRWEYAPIPSILRDHNLNEERVEVEEDLSVNLDELKKKVCRRSVFYISMPNNPTGYFSPADLSSVAEIMAANDGAVIWDAAYLFTILKLASNSAKFDNVFLQAKLSELKKITAKHYHNMCILSSLSKTCLIAGLRFGFATAYEQWIENMNAIIGRENLSSPTPSFIIGAEILRGFLENPRTYEWVCRILADRLTVLMEEIPSFLMLPKNGMFGALYVIIRTNEEGTRFTDKLIKEFGIVTVPGNPFHGGPVEAIRLSLVSVPWSDGDEEWIHSVKALKKALV